MNGNDTRTVADSMEETKERHVRYLRAMNNPARRIILRELKKHPLTLEELVIKIGIDQKTVKWHLDILQWGYCVEKKNNDSNEHYYITKEGTVVDYTDK